MIGGDMIPIVDFDTIPTDELAFYKRPEAAEFLQSLGLPISRTMLAHYAHKGIGPYFTKCGKWSIYPRHELLAWAMQWWGDHADNHPSPHRKKVAA
jgi:hypothetical protein